jgi:hypothetical protein
VHVCLLSQKLQKVKKIFVQHSERVHNENSFSLVHFLNKKNERKKIAIFTHALLHQLLLLLLLMENDERKIILYCNHHCEAQKCIFFLFSVVIYACASLLWLQQNKKMDFVTQTKKNSFSPSYTYSCLYFNRDRRRRRRRKRRGVVKMKENRARESERERECGEEEKSSD